MIKRSRTISARGFTMIEMIIALALVAIIATSLASVLWTVYHTTRQAEAAITPPSQASIALGFLTDDLQNALQPPSVSNQTSLIGDFEGIQGTDSRGHEADDIQFYSTADAAQHVDANGEVKHIEYTVVQPTGSTDYVLVRRVVRNLLPTTMTPAPDEEIICRGVSSFTVQYFDGTNWNTTWDSTAEDNTIPAAVQVALELQTTTPDGKVQTSKYTRVIPLSTSTASIDPNVGGGAM